MVAVAFAAVDPPLTVKFAEVEPAGIVMDAGTIAAALLLLSEMTAPPAGAALPRVTVPCAVAPAMIVPGAIAKDDSGGWIVSVELTLAPA